MMNSCTFFGHRDCPETLLPALEAALIELIESKDVTHFYVGNQGTFDRLVRTSLRKLTARYPHIRYTIVLAYMPDKMLLLDEEDQKHTILPEGIENRPQRFAISYRNDLMLANAEYVICYIAHGWGGTAKFVEKALRKKKCVINLGSYSFVDT